MNIIIGEWLEIIKYRDFYDIPRLILARDSKGELFIFDSEFDELIDEYCNRYSIYPCGTDEMAAIDIFSNHATGEKGRKTCEVIISRIEFDPTTRRKLRLNL